VKLRILKETLAVAKLQANTDLGAWASAGELVQIVRTPTELSIVCRDAAVPPGVTVERGWRCFASTEALDLNATGILASMAVPLAHAGVAIFVISSFDNDFVMVHSRDLERAVTTLKAAGFAFED